MSKKVILDTSVIVKWFSLENLSEIALKLRDKIYMEEVYAVIPDLVLYELTNSLKNKKELNSEIVKEAIDYLADMQLDIIYPSANIIKEAVDLSYTLNITSYDAYFVALAKETDLTLITADFKLYEKLKVVLDFVVYLPNIDKVL